MIKIDRVTKLFGPTVAVRNVSFEVEKGEILGFLGPNGAGKTTTMRIITGYFPPTDGNAYVAGYSVLDQPLEVKKRIGYVPENPAMYGDMRTIEYLRFIGAIKGVPKPKLKEGIEKVVETCALQEVTSKPIRSLSRGYKQRVSLAQALINDPPVLILDEPTSGLDPKQIHEIRQLIKSMGGERTIIISTHILPEVSVTCSKVVIINEGRIVAMDSTENIGKSFSKSHQIELRVEGDPEKIRDRLLRLDGVKSVVCTDNTLLVDTVIEKDIRAQIAKTVVESGTGLLELKARAMSLEDVFLKLVTEEEVTQ
ncbi:MAG: ABC transporter ATP-binding protein [Spirochaetota bacterium]